MGFSLTQPNATFVSNSPRAPITQIGPGGPPNPITDPNQQAVYQGAEQWDTVNQILYRFFGTQWFPFPVGTVHPPGNINWISTSNSQGTLSNTGYLITSGSAPVILTLPATSVVGDIVYFKGVVTAVGALPPVPGFTVGQLPGQQILQTNAVATTIGSTGSMVAPAMGMFISLICVVANTTWNVMPMTSGSFIFN